MALCLTLGLSACERPAELRWAWVGEGPSRSGLTPIEDGVIFGNEAGALVRLHHTGMVRWRAQVGREIAARPAVVGAVVVAATVGGDWIGVALQNGQEKWRLGGKPALTGPLAADETRAYALAEDGSVFAISGASGGTVWKLLAPRGMKKTLQTIPPPVAANGKVYVALGSAGLYALHPTDGDTAWKKELGEIVGFLVEGARVYVLTKQKMIAALNAESGAVEWQRTLDEDVRGGPWLARGLLWVSFGEAGLLSVDPQDGAETWRVHLPAPVRGGVGDFRELVLVPTNGREGRLLGFRPGQTEPIIDVRADSALRTTPHVVADTVMAQAADGRVLGWQIKRTSR